MKRFIVTMTGLIIALLLLVIWNVTSGSVSVDGMQMWQVLLRQTREGTFYHIVWDIRMPRLLAALFLGGALAVSGFLLQTFFQNPIAGPYVLGILPWHGGGSLYRLLACHGLCPALIHARTEDVAFGRVWYYDRLYLFRYHRLYGDFRVRFQYRQPPQLVYGQFFRYGLEGCRHDRRLSHTYGLSHLFYGKTDRSISDGRSIRQKHGRQHSSAPHPFDSFIQPFVRLCDSLCGTYLLCGDCRSASGQAGDENGKTALSDPGLFFGRSGRDPFL